MGFIDLHTHTTASDGTLRPAELVSLAVTRGLTAIAITDHDTIDGLPEALATASGIEVIPGVEISADYNGELHILGYYFDAQSQVLEDKLAELRSYRDERNPKIVQRLRELGCRISLSDVERVAMGKVIGRPHFAHVLLEKGFVGSIGEAFERFLAVGKPAYFKKEKLTPEEAIAVITSAGGLPVLAHPKYLQLKPVQLEELVLRLKASGLKGIEVYYTTHSSLDTGIYRNIAAKHGLIATGGSDFHGSNKPDVAIGIGNGDLCVDAKLLDGLKDAAQDLR